MNDLMQGKTCLVTGANQGIGYETARALAEMGASVVLAGRDEGRCALAVENIKAQTGNPNISYLVADLSLSSDVNRLAVDFTSRHDRLDVLVNNAGGMTRQRKTVEGDFEFCWKLNHLGYFLLTAALLPLMKSGTPARIVNVASTAHRRARINFDDLQTESDYSMWTAYGQSKLANIMFTYALARRLEGSGVTANCLHPGIVASGFVANIGPLEKVLSPLVKLFMISSRAGAKTSVFLASSPEVEGVSGKYFDKRRPVKSSLASYDEAVQEQLWDVSMMQSGADGF